jgi:anti-anti-sigma factor
MSHIEFGPFHIGGDVTFIIDIERDGPIVGLRCDGELDVAGCPKLIDAFDRTLSRDLARVVVDLRQVTFIDSTGLGCLLHGSLKADSLGVSFAVLPGSHVREFLEATALSHRLGSIDRA